MKSFFFKGLEFRVFPDVYEPSEDSFILAENVSVKKGASFLDAGCGSGIQGINAAMQGASKVVCTDVDGNALENAMANAKKAGFLERFEFRQGNLFECLGAGEMFNVIAFNPPYMPSDGKKFGDLDGGEFGRDALDCFLNCFGTHLAPGGECFFLQSSLNGEKETGIILEGLGFEFEVLARKRLFFEELAVFRAWRKETERV